jgi:hypothetical protein
MDPVKMKRETIKISDDRNLYNYTFEFDDETGEAEATDQKETELLTPFDSKRAVGGAQ